MVEFIIILPLLLIMISGLIEFGFMLNFYLDLIDGTRDIARFSAMVDPLNPPADDLRDCDNSTYFYRLITCLMPRALGQQIELDLTADDVVVSSFGVSGGTVVDRYPDADGWSWSSDWLGNATPNHTSQFTTAQVDTMLASFASAPDTGVVMVEVFYDYHMVLALPWITVFVPNPVTLHAYSIMPNPFVEP